MNTRNDNPAPAQSGSFAGIINRLFTPGGISSNSAIVISSLAMLLVFAADVALPDNLHLHILYAFPLAMLAFHCERGYIVLGWVVLAIYLVLTTHISQHLETEFVVADGMITSTAMLLISWLARTARNQSVLLRASEQEARSILDNTQDTVVRYDRDCRRIYVNPAFGAMTEGGINALLGKSPSESPGGENARIYEATIREVLASGAASCIEHKWPGKGGREICSLVELTPERDPSGAIVSVLGVGRDISALKRTEQELKASMRLLEEKEAAKTRFLAAAGHDLRQPLAAANLFIDALRFTHPTSAQNQIIQRLDKVMVNFNDLLESMLNVSKLDAGVIRPEFAWISLAEIFNWLEESFTGQAVGKRLKLRIHFPARKGLAVYCDVGLLKSVLSNLVSNAIKFTEQGGVLIGARQRGGNVLIQTWDSGVGIAPDEIEKIFDDFYQVGNWQRDRVQGLGLGLSIVRRSLELLDGKISCRSQPGRGSVFEFQLPAGNILHSIGDEKDSSDSMEQELIQSLAQGKRFVVLEDDPTIADALKNSLEIMGAEVACFDNAEAALQHPGIHEADYFVVDYMLSGDIDGIRFLNTLQKESQKPIRAVMISGDTSADFIRSAERFDWQVLHKPINLLKLARALDEN